MGETLKLGYAFEQPINNTALTGFGTHSLMVSLDMELLADTDGDDGFLRKSIWLKIT